VAVVVLSHEIHNYFNKLYAEPLPPFFPNFDGAFAFFPGWFCLRNLPDPSPASSCAIHIDKQEGLNRPYFSFGWTVPALFLSSLIPHEVYEECAAMSICNVFARIFLAVVNWPASPCRNWAADLKEIRRAAKFATLESSTPIL